MLRFDYECRKGHQFTLWNTEGLLCPLCGSKRIKKIFLTAPAAVTGKAAQIDKLAEQQLDAAGLSNYTNVGGSVRRTRKTHPTEIAAQAAAKAHNVPMTTTTGPMAKGLDGRIQAMREQYRSMGAQGLIKSMGGQGKTVVTNNPRGPGALVQNVVQRGKQIAPLASMGERIYHPKAKEDGAILKSIMGNK